MPSALAGIHSVSPYESKQHFRQKAPAEVRLLEREGIILTSIFKLVNFLLAFFVYSCK